MGRMFGAKFLQMFDISFQWGNVFIFWLWLKIYCLTKGPFKGVWKNLLRHLRKALWPSKSRSNLDRSSSNQFFWPVGPRFPTIWQCHPLFSTLSSKFPRWRNVSSLQFEIIVIKIFWSIELYDLWSKKMIVWSGATFILGWSCFKGACAANFDFYCNFFCRLARILDFAIADGWNLNHFFGIAARKIYFMVCHSEVFIVQAFSLGCKVQLHWGIKFHVCLSSLNAKDIKFRQTAVFQSY